MGDWIMGTIVGDYIRTTLTYQNLLFCRVPIDSIFRFMIRTYKEVGFGRLRYDRERLTLHPRILA